MKDLIENSFGMTLCRANSRLFTAQCTYLRKAQKYGNLNRSRSAIPSNQYDIKITKIYNKFWLLQLEGFTAIVRLYIHALMFSLPEYRMIS